MEGWKIDELRRRAEDGASFDASDVLPLVEAVRRLQRAAAVPAEFIVRVARSESDVDRWEATHPLVRMSTSASHPADALALASAELRRMLTNHDWPADQTRWPRGRVERAVADAHAAVDTETAASLRWALAELDRTRDELHAQRAGAALHVRARSGDAAAREQLRLQNRARLDAAGVTASSREWDTDGFGRAEDVDLALPCLALATTVHEVDDLDGLHFKQIRRWHALQHRTAPRPLSRYRTAVVTPLQLNPAADLALRRIAPRVPTGRSVGTYRTFHDLLATELPGHRREQNH